MNSTEQPAVAGPVEPTVMPLAERLRADMETWEGHYSDEMWVRYYPAPPLQLEAADEIERLLAENKRLQASVEKARDRLQRIVDEPSNTMSDAKALREILRQAKLGLAGA